VKPETSFRRNKVDPFLKSLKNCYFDAIAQKGKSGSPDYYLCINGYFVALEVKSEGGALTALQDYTLKKVVFRGRGISLVAYPENWDEVKDKLSKLDKEIR